MNRPKQYLAVGGKHVSSSFAASVNYFDSFNPEQSAAVRDRITADVGENVIIDGDDNLHANAKERPEVFIVEYNKQRLGITHGEMVNDGVLAYYHSKTSGITNSGIVVSPQTFDALSEWYAQTYGVAIDKNPRLKLYFNCDSTAL